MITDVKSAEWTRMTNHEKEQRQGWDNSAWVNWQFTPMRQLAFSGGLRLTAFSALGGPYYDPQGRDFFAQYRCRTHAL